MNPNNLTQEQIQQGYSTIPGAYNPVTGQLKSTITTDQLTPAPKVDLTPSFTPQPDLATGIVTGAQQGVNQFQKDYERFLGLQNQNQDKSLENMISSITGDLQGLQGRGQAQLEAESRLGVNQFNQQLAGLNTQIGSKIAEYNQNLANQRAELAQMEAGAGAKGLTTGMLLGQQGAVEKVRSAQNAQAAADIGLLQAQALGLQGQAKAAQEAANRAVDLLYQDREATVNTKLKQIELFTPLFNASEKKKADALTYALGNEQKKLEEEKDNLKAVQNLIVNASGQGAPQDLLNRANKAKTQSEAAMILGQYAGDYYKTELLKQQIATEKAQRSKIYSDISIAQAKSDGTNIAGKPLKVSNAEITNLNEALTARDSVNSLVNKFKENISTYGTQTLFGKASGERDALRTNLLLAIKNMEKTGALDAGTINVLEGTIPSSTFFATEAAQQAALDTLLSTVESKVTSYINSYKGTSAESDPRTKRAFLSEEVPPGTPNPFSAALGTPSTPIPGTSIINKVEDDGSIVFKIPTTTPITK